jgi:hypothetical protein
LDSSLATTIIYLAILYTSSFGTLSHLLSTSLTAPTPLEHLPTDNLDSTLGGYIGGEKILISAWTLSFRHAIDIDYYFITIRLLKTVFPLVK